MAYRAGQAVTSPALPSGHGPPCRDPQHVAGSGMALEAAERWCDAWELEATGRGLPRDGAHWQLGAEWIATERAARRPGW